MIEWGENLLEDLKRAVLKCRFPEISMQLLMWSWCPTHRKKALNLLDEGLEKVVQKVRRSTKNHYSFNTMKDNRMQQLLRFFVACQFICEVTTSWDLKVIICRILYNRGLFAIRFTSCVIHCWTLETSFNIVQRSSTLYEGSINDHPIHWWVSAHLKYKFLPYFHLEDTRDAHLLSDFTELWRTMTLTMTHTPPCVW